MVSARTTVNKQDDIAGKTRDGLIAGLRDAADRGFEKSQEKVAQNSTDTGQLLKSGVMPKVLEDGTVEWGYSASYAADVEFGTAPHWPPIEPLLGWARRVLGDEGAAYAVQQKIAENGTQPQPFVRPGVEEMRRALRADNIAEFVEVEL